MIWLSLPDAANKSFYLDVRDILLDPEKEVPSGTICGTVGDGTSELWTEIRLGGEESAQLLPVLHDNGKIESFTGQVDEVLLQKELISSVKGYLFGSGAITSGPEAAAPAESRHREVQPALAA